ncbi:hypothetical protein MCC_03430 [Rickettsia rhipicephali str. 3-7-female6-CWPP]|uniref:Uncharacterized protein n=1 Tax=Rickettsia rhipicephali (strain 3-7-female6-CWPP) TaxID=1105113 RepID=A0AAI8A9J9_RICR3|nr:hypothetical protein MCC_03430 [Rickettsia rhipicephali str. 3-7-female6-CWPP]
MRYFLAKINKIFKRIATPISKKTYNLQQKITKIKSS